MKRSNVQVDNRGDASSVSSGVRKRAKFETEEIPKLNQSDPQHAHRIQQRRQTIAKGKNTVGYDEYIKQVPKHKRRPRSMKHPTTPDHTLDIPNKRWQGLVKAWRRALHQYDPPDLMTAFDHAAAESETTTPATSTADDTGVQEKQLTEAVEKGLLVDVSREQNRRKDEGISPATLVSQPDMASPQKEVDELDEFDKARVEDDEFFLDEEDSDDDLI